MKRLLRILRRVVVTLGLLAAAGLVAWVFVLPGFVEGRVRRALQDAGFPGADLTLRAISLRGADVAGLRLDPGGRVAVSAISVDYDLASLRESRVHTIRVTGVKIRLDVRGGEIDLGPLEALRGGESSSAGPRELPFDRLFAEGELILTLDGAPEDLPLRISVEQKDPGIRLGLDTSIRGRRVAVEWEGDLGSLRGKARVEVHGTRREGLEAHLSAEGDFKAGDLGLRVEGHADRIDEALGDLRIVVEGLVFDASTSVTGYTGLAEVRASARAAAIETAGQRFERLSLDVVPSDGTDSAHLALARGDVALSAGTSLPIRDFRRILADGIDLPLAVSLKGSLPPEALQAARTLGWSYDSARASIDGSMTVRARPDRWAVEDLRLSTTFAAEGLRHRASGATLRTLDAGMSWTGEVTPDRAGIVLAKGARIEADPVLPGVLERGHVVIVAEDDVRSEAVFRSGRTDWMVDFPGISVDLRDLGPAPGPVRIAGLGGSLGISGAAAPVGLDARIGVGSRLRAEGVEAAGVRVDRVELATTAPARIMRNEGGAWGVEAPGLAITAEEPGAIEVADLRLDGIRADVPLAVEGGDREIRVRVLPGARITTPRAAARDYAASPVELRIGEASVVELELSAPGGPRVRGRLEVASGGPFAVTGPDAGAEVNGLGLEARATLAGGSLSGAAGVLTIATDRILLRFAELELRGAAFRIPFGTGDEAALPEPATVPRDGSFGVRELLWRGRDLPVPAVRLVRSGGETAFDVEWPITDVATLRGKGTVSLAGGRPVGRASLRIPPFSLHAGGRISDAVKAGTGFTVTGAAELEGEVAFDGPHVDPRIRIALKGMDILGKEGAQEFRGITSDVTIESVSPLSTPGAQTIGFESAKIGDMRVDKGEFRFRVESPQSILVERAEWRLGSTGLFWAYAFRFDPRAPNVTVEMFTEKLQLGDWLSTVTVDNATGIGELYGRLTLTVRTNPSLAVKLGTGFLHAEGSGSIQIADTEALREVLAANLPKFEGDVDYSGVIQDRIIGALRDFEYSVLRFDVVEENGLLVLKAQARGKGKEEPHQALDLKVNLGGFDELIGPALALKLGIDKEKSRLLKGLSIGK